MRGACPQGCVSQTGGGGPGWGAGALSKVRDKKRWWQWPEEGPDTDWARGIRKGGLGPGRSRGGRWREAPRPRGRGQGLCPAQTPAEAAWAALPSRASTAAHLPADEPQGRAGQAPQKGADSRSPLCVGRQRRRDAESAPEGFSPEGCAGSDRNDGGDGGAARGLPGLGVREGPRWTARPVSGAALCPLLLSPPALCLETPAESRA